MSEQTQTPRRIQRPKPIRDMIGASASTVTSAMVATRDLVQALGYEAKTMKLESYMDYKAFLIEASKELGMSTSELESLMA